MKIVNLQELRKRVADIQNEIACLDLILQEDNVVIADIPAPEKKARKKRVKKEKKDVPDENEQPKPPIPHRGRKKGSKNKPFGEPKLREGEEPV